MYNELVINNYFSAHLWLWYNDTSCHCAGALIVAESSKSHEWCQRYIDLDRIFRWFLCNNETHQRPNLSKTLVRSNYCYRRKINITLYVNKDTFLRFPLDNLRSSVFNLLTSKRVWLWKDCYEVILTLYYLGLLGIVFAIKDMHNICSYQWWAEK